MSATVWDMTDTLRPPSRSIDGPLAGTTDRRILIDGKVDSRIGPVAAVCGLASVFLYAAGESRDVSGEMYVKYHFERPDSEPVKTARDTDSD